MKTCKYCSKEFVNAANYRRHIVYCKKVKDVDLQKEYDSGLSMYQICNKYDISRKFAYNHINCHRTNFDATAMRKSESPSEYFFGGTRRISKGEQRFWNMLTENGISKQYRIIQQFHIFGYKLDFAFIDIKLCVEIDGLQHYTRDKDRDAKRDDILMKNGWNVYRIASKDFLRRSGLIFDKFISFLNTKQKPKLVKYDGQIIDGDEEWIKERTSRILNSRIDFSKIGWTIKLGEFLGIHSATARRWVMNNMPKFYFEQCRTPRMDFKRCS